MRGELRSVAKQEGKLPLNIRVRRATFAIVDGNSNNDAHVGTFYLNLNNTVSNANWNIGTADSYSFIWSDNQMHT